MKKKRKAPQGAKVLAHRNALRVKKHLCTTACGSKGRPPVVRRQ
jgi:hypothetical protein